MDRSVDVVVVGGGIAGSALATVLARRGLDVVVLERQTAYRDKVRGEVLSCWGVAEALRLDLEKPLLDAGGHYVNRMVPYDEVTAPEHAEAGAVPLDRLLPDVPGALDVGHPAACEALLQAAAAAGAQVVRGVGELDVEPGATPSVRYRHGTDEHTLRCRLVVGADGRTSTVRRAIGVELQQSVPRTLGGGMLVDGLDAWPADRCALGTEGDLHYLLFPRAGGRVRLYLLHDVAQRGRFAGPDRAAAFLVRLPPLHLHPGRRRDVRRGPPGRAVRVLPDERHLDRPAVRARGGAGRGRRRLERPDHRAGPVHRAARRTPGHRHPGRRAALVHRGVRAVRRGAPGADAAAAGGRPASSPIWRRRSARPARPAGAPTTRSSARTRCSAGRARCRSWARTTCPPPRSSGPTSSGSWPCPERPQLSRAGPRRPCEPGGGAAGCAG